MIYVAIGPNAWGKSDKSVDAALREMKRHVPGFATGKLPYRVLEINGEFKHIDWRGTVEYVGTCRVAKEGTFTRRAR